MCMADSIDSLGDVLENRYAHTHVGGAFDAKRILKPKTVEQALESATMGRKADESLMIEGLDTQRYIWHDNILPEKEQQTVYGPRGVAPRTITANPSIRYVRILPDIAKFGQNARTSVVVSNQIIPAPAIRPSAGFGISPGQNPRAAVVVSNKIVPEPSTRTSNIESVVPGQNPRKATVVPVQLVPQSTPRRPMEVAATIYGQNMRIVRYKIESGSGKPGVPSSRPFTPTPGPGTPTIVPIPVPIYWNTDPDIWDYAKLIGQTYWDS